MTIFRLNTGFVRKTYICINYKNWITNLNIQKEFNRTNFLEFFFAIYSTIQIDTRKQSTNKKLNNIESMMVNSVRRGWMIQLGKSRSVALKSIQNVYARLVTGSSGISIVHASKRLKDDLSLFYSVAGVYTDRS